MILTTWSWRVPCRPSQPFLACSAVGQQPRLAHWQGNKESLGSRAGEACWRQQEMHTCVALPAATRPAATRAAIAKQKPCITGMPCIRACNATTAEYVCLQAVWKMGACSAPAQWQTGRKLHQGSQGLALMGYKQALCDACLVVLQPRAPLWPAEAPSKTPYSCVREIH